MLLQRKIAITLFVVCACCFFMTVALISIQANELLQERAIKHTEEITFRHARTISSDLEKNLNLAKTIATSFETVRENSNGLMNLRTTFTSMLQRVMIQNPKIYAIGTVWEANALDGQDNQYINQPTHDSTGRFIPYLHRKNNYVQLEPVNSYENQNDNEFYKIIKNNPVDTLIKPYYYKVNNDPVLMTSILVPIFIQSKFSGVMCVDMNIQELQNKINNIEFYKNTRIYLIHKDGTFIGHPNSKKIMTNIQQDQTLNQFFKKNPSDDLITQVRQKDDNFYYNSISLNTDDLKSDWILIIGFPINQILADNDILYKLSFLIATSSTILITAILFFLLRQFIYRPLFEFSKHILYVNQYGNFSEEFAYSGSDDELSDAIKAFNHFTSNLNQFINECSAVMHKVSQGDLNYQIKHNTKGDLLVLKRAINESIFNIKAICDHLKYVSQNLNDGRFKSNQDYDYLTGNFKNIVDSLNQSMISIDDALSLIRELTNALAHQNYSKVIDQQFMGDLELLRIQLNQIMNHLNQSHKN